MSKFSDFLMPFISFNNRNSLAYLQKSFSISNRILFFSSIEGDIFPISLITFAGLPAANTLGGILFETTDPPPTITFSSIVIDGNTITCHGIHTLSFITTSANLYGWPSNAFLHALWVKIRQYYYQ